MNEIKRYKKYELARNHLYELLKKTISHEFLNRIDGAIMFLPLG